MLNRRLIPKLQLRRSRVGAGDQMVIVTTMAFQDAVEVGNAVSQARIFQAQAADELIFLDLDAWRDDRQTLAKVVRSAAEEIFMPFTVGGGVRTVEDFGVLLANGADKVAVNTAAIEEPALITAAANTFGSQCVVASIDCRREPYGRYRVWVRGGTVATDLEPVAWAVEAQARGAGEVLLTSIDNDGSRQGLDLDITKRVVAAVDVPVIAAGGCGTAADFVAGFDAGADAVAAGTYFCFQDQNLMQTRSHIRNAGFPIRVHT